jgi:hypothetical protein
MPRLLALAACALALSAAASAQTPPAATPVAQPRPPAGLAPPSAVEAAPLAQDAFSTGTLVRGEGALDADLWKRADPVRVGLLLDAAPARPAAPSLGEALRRTLLSSGSGPQNAAPSLGGKKLFALARAGYWDEARTIASLSSAPKSDPHVAQALAAADLLDGAVNEACKRNATLTSGRDAPYWVKLRVLCFSLAGQSDAADLTLTLLREQGFLTEADAAILGWVASGVAPKTPPGPANALHLAALRSLGTPIAAGGLGAADGGVLKALARDATVAPATRVEAAMRAAAMGAIRQGELTAIFDSIEVEPGDLAKVGEAVAARPGDPMTDVLLYHSVQAMSAPEFLRDKAGRIAQALALGDSFARAYATSALYGEDIVALEGAIVPAAEAARFALARMAVGDGDGAARWLFAMIGSGGANALPEAEQLDLIDLVNLLAVLDPISAKAVAEAANVALDPRSLRSGEAGGAGAADVDVAARVVESAFDAAIDDSPGQAALAALAASAVLGASDPFARVVVSQSLRAAGLNELRRRMDFETVWRTRFAASAPTPAPGAEPGASPAAPIPAAATTTREGPAPRLKPTKSGGAG